jgi:hypothetical protein
MVVGCSLTFMQVTLVGNILCVEKLPNHTAYISYVLDDAMGTPVHVRSNSNESDVFE